MLLLLVCNNWWIMTAFSRKYAALLAEQQDRQRRDAAIARAFGRIEAGNCEPVTLTSGGVEGHAANGKQANGRECLPMPSTRPAGIKPGPLTHRPPVASLTRRCEPAGAAGGATPIYPLVDLCRAAGLPEPLPEFRFHKVRRYRFDYAWPIRRIAVEIEGGVWTQGRHTRGSGFIEDMRKYNLASLLGWRILRYQPSELATLAIADLRIEFASGAA